MGEPARVSDEKKPPTQPKQALVLSGGNVKGAYQAGAIAETLQGNRFKPSDVYGISVGSISATSTSGTQRKRPGDMSPIRP